MKNIKKWWRYSSLRFYIMNALWNYKFWLNCTKEYTTIEYYTFHSARNENPDKVTRKRFIGYKYKGKIYSDNPGIIIKDRDVWEAWNKRGLIN